MKKLWCAVIACCGCASPSVDVFPDTSTISTTTTTTTASVEPPGYESGTRLRARVYVGEDGSRQFMGWHDSQLGVDCYFTVATDGVLRCLPLRSAGVGTLFVDAVCSQPAAVFTQPCLSPTHAILSVSGCPTSMEVHALGSAVTDVYSGTSANCTAATTNSGWSYFTVGPVVAPTEFVAATEQVE